MAIPPIKPPNVGLMNASSGIRPTGMPPASAPAAGKAPAIRQAVQPPAAGIQRFAGDPGRGAAPAAGIRPTGMPPRQPGFDPGKATPAPGFNASAPRKVTPEPGQRGPISATGLPGRPSTPPGMAVRAAAPGAAQRNPRATAAPMPVRQTASQPPSGAPRSFPAAPQPAGIKPTGLPPRQPGYVQEKDPTPPGYDTTAPRKPDEPVLPRGPISPNDVLRRR